MSDSLADEIVEYWLGDSVNGPEAAREQREKWYRGGARVDDEIRSRFGDAVVLARESKLEAWEATAKGALALVIVLDQFTRNIFRGTTEAYSGDRTAHSVATRTVEAGKDKALPCVGRIFLYHPFHHSELLAEQDRAIALLEAMQRSCEPIWHDYIGRSIEGFRGHRDIVARFGRFPHRNRTLGRQSTKEEIAYLESKSESYGQ